MVAKYRYLVESAEEGSSALSWFVCGQFNYFRCTTGERRNWAAAHETLLKHRCSVPALDGLGHHCICVLGWTINIEVQSCWLHL